jgi:hypothetical protein
VAQGLVTEHACTIHGLHVRSNVPLPARPSGGPAPYGDVRVSVAEEPVAAVAEGDGRPAVALGLERTWRLEDGGCLTRFDAPSTDDAWAMRFPPGGSSIEVEWTAGLPLADLLVVVRTIGLATVLQMRGAVMLHGCAVDVGGHAVVACGASGAGKSTLAAAFVRAGAELLSDDVAVVDGACVHPGAPMLQVAPATAAAMGWRGLPRVFATPLMGDKVQLAVPARSAGPRPLAAIYVLEPRRAGPLAIGALTPAEALSQLVRHVFRREAHDRAAWRLVFPQLARVAADLPVRRLTCPEHLDGLDAVVAQVQAHALAPL